MGGFLSRAEIYGIGKRLRQEIESIFAVKLCQETLRPLAGDLNLQAVPSTRTTPEESGRYQQQPQTVSRTLGKTSLEINELALRARERGDRLGLWAQDAGQSPEPSLPPPRRWLPRAPIDA